MIKILNSKLERLGVIKTVENASRSEEINGENTLDFQAVLNAKLNTYIDENAVFELSNDYFDIGFFKKDVNEDGTFTIEVESDHISYRLNNEIYNVETFTETGTPEYILGKILEGTNFTVGTVEYSTAVTFSAQEAMSRRALLMQFIAYLGGEARFNKFQIDIVTHRGNTEIKPIIKGKNVNLVQKTVNKREKDTLGNSLVSYTCTPIYLPGDEYSLGDDIFLIQGDLYISEQLRVTSFTYNPYNIAEITLKIGNYINTLASNLYQIETTSVTKEKIYNGCKIGPENGFEAIQSDKMARAIFNSTSLKMQKGDGTGENWEDVLFFDPIAGTYKFVGEIVLEDPASLGLTAEDVGARPDNWTPSASDVGALATNWVGTTHINAYGIYTGEINANQITAGTISANMISGGSLYGVSVTATDFIASDSAQIGCLLYVFSISSSLGMYINSDMGCLSGYGSRILIGRDGCALDYNNSVMRLKKDNSNYLSYTTNEAMCYFTNSNGGNRPNIRPDGFYVGSTKVGSGGGTALFA